jgi:hypothetical protein
VDFQEAMMKDSKTRIRQDIIRSFRKNLGHEAMFMCFYVSEAGGEIVTNDRLFTGEELIGLFSSVISSTEDFMVPAIMYSLFNVYGPIKVFDIVKDYSRGFDMKGPYGGGGGSGTSVPPVADN